MAGGALWGRLLQLRLSTALFAVLWYTSVAHLFIYHGSYNYDHIPPHDIPKRLHKAVSPNLHRNPKLPDCNYDLLDSTESLYYDGVPDNYDNFMPTGISNGSYTPSSCNPLFSVAILVTYRSRQKQLDIFLPYIHNFLRKQNIHYKIFLIEQQDNSPWNKGALYNIGAKFAIAEKFPCLILHDVDLLPLDASNLYVCLDQPRHMSASIDRLRYILPYDYLVGGALAMQSLQYKHVNGFSNKFLDWGGEDDNLAHRLFAQKLQILRFPRQMSRYTMLSHHKQKKNDNRFKVMQESQEQFHQDGFNSVTQKTLHLKRYELFTLIGVKL